MSVPSYFDLTFVVAIIGGIIGAAEAVVVIVVVAGLGRRNVYSIYG